MTDRIIKIYDWLTTIIMWAFIGMWFAVCALLNDEFLITVIILAICIAGHRLYLYAVRRLP